MAGDPVTEVIDDAVNEINASIDETSRGCFGAFIIGFLALLALSSGGGR